MYKSMLNLELFFTHARESQLEEGTQYIYLCIYIYTYIYIYIIIIRTSPQQLSTYFTGVVITEFTVRCFTCER